MLASDQATHFTSNMHRPNSDRKVMLFELDTRGHHPGYIQHLVKYWCDEKLPGQLDVLVSQKFRQQHSNIVEIPSQCEQQTINFVAITPEEQAVLFESSQLESSFKGRIIRAFQEWDLLRKYAVSLGTTHCLLMYLDTILLRLAFGAKFPCKFSSIYFRPIFHYSTFANYTPAGREGIWQLRDKVCLPQILRSSQLQTIFCLDPLAVEPINNINRKNKAVYLPDPVQIYNNNEPQLEKLQESLGIDSSRQVFLLFGVLAERKGIYQLLEAVKMLSPDLCQKLCLLLIGPIQLQEKELIQTQIAEISQSLPVQIICRHDFVTDQEIQPYFQIADVILAPYQRHIGMSAILVRAAAAQKPVLSSDFGLMGEVTRRYELGLAVDSTVPTEITKGFTRFLCESPGSFVNHEKMKQFAEQNDAKQFATTIFKHLQVE
jgi:glycosyltransferase involved in cell wall biosynthesis